VPFATGSGVRIHYEIDGDGPPLVLHAGFMGTITDWYDFGYADALKGTSTLVLIDPRGQGESEKPHESEAYSTANRVADVLAVLDALGIARLDFLGYSMGGRTGFDLGACAPERLSSLIVGGAQPFGSPPNTAWAELLAGGMEPLLEEADRLTGPLPDRVRGRSLASDPAALAAACLVERPSLEGAFSRITVPALLYCGDQDASLASAKRAAGLLPQASFVALAGLNHRQAWLDSGASMPHVTKFLRRVRTPAGSS
jgi:pimeloyl-ACP methyl ester carboxylesterase